MYIYIYVCVILPEFLWFWYLKSCRVSIINSSFFKYVVLGLALRIGILHGPGVTDISATSPVLAREVSGPHGLGPQRPHRKIDPTKHDM